MTAGWAVVDVETTGLHPVRDRIVEIAVIRLDEDALPVDEWSTLVNPRGRPPGHVHGLSAAALSDAPLFRDVLDDVLARLSGRVIVAHNAAFDIGFLQAETIRAGIAWGPVEGLCTMEVLHALGVVHSRKLEAICVELGIAKGPQHVALDDARAVVGVMQYLAPRLWALPAPDPAPTWPPPPVPHAIRARTVAGPVAIAAIPEALAQNVRVPAGLGITEGAGATYLGVLDLIVEDGTVTDDEVEALSLFAHTAGITRNVARQLNAAYLDGMSRLARADGVVTDAEREHLINLTVLLGRALPR